MQTNVIDLHTKRPVLPESARAEKFAKAQKRQIKREIIGHFYEIEKSILESPQNEYSEDARQGIISLINYFKHL